MTIQRLIGLLLTSHVVRATVSICALQIAPSSVPHTPIGEPVEPDVYMT